MSKKAFGDFYSYLHCLNLLSKSKDGLTPRQFLEDVKEQPFYYRSSSNAVADYKWSERILEAIYKYHGDYGCGPSNQTNIIECIGTASKAVYKIKDGKVLDFNPGISESISVLTLVEDDLFDKFLPTKGDKLKSVLSLVSDAKGSRVKDLYSCRSATYDIIEPDVEYSVLKDVEQSLDNRCPLSFDYNDARRDVDPYGLFVYGKVFYLIGMERYKSGETNKVMTQDYRTYAIHRINNTEVHTNMSFAMGVEKDFSLEDYLFSKSGQYFNGGLDCSVTLKMKKNRLGQNKFVDEYKLSECQEILSQDEQHYFLKAKARDCLDFEKWLVANAKTVEILTPEYIREKVIRYLQRGMKNYAI